MAPAPLLGGGRVWGQADMLLLQAAKILQTNQIKNQTKNNHNLQVKENGHHEDTNQSFIIVPIYDYYFCNLQNIFTNYQLAI